MSKLTPLQIFLWKFTKIYTKSNHFAKKKKRKKKRMSTRLQVLQTHEQPQKCVIDPVSSDKEVLYQ